jgi:hypothetical protein
LTASRFPEDILPSSSMARYAKSAMAAAPR